MESGNKVVGLVVLGLIVGVVGFFGRAHFVHLFAHEPAAAVTSGKSLAVGGRVIVEAFGKPYIAEDALDKKLQQMLQSSPSTRGMDAATLPAGAKVKFLKDWVNFLLIKDVWGKEHNVENDAAFKKRYDDAVEALKDSLIIDAFVQDLKKDVSVSDEEVSEEYHSNKDRFIKTPGGVNCAVVEFSDAASAKALQKQAQDASSLSEFQRLAVDGKFSALGFVDVSGASSNAHVAKLPTEVKRVIFGKHSESVVFVPAEDSYYVVFMSERREPQFHSLDRIGGQLKSELEESKHLESLNNALESLRNKANLVIKMDVLGAPVGNQPRVLTKEELAAVIEQEEAAAMADDAAFADANG